MHLRRCHHDVVVHCRIQTRVAFVRETELKIGHDMLDTPAEVRPCLLEISRPRRHVRKVDVRRGWGGGHGRRR